MAPEFLRWLGPVIDLDWLDIGCGTGALSEAIVQNSRPGNLACIDPSRAFMERTRGRLPGSAGFHVGTAEDLPFSDDRFDVVVSGLALNFFPDPDKALAEMRRVTRSGGTIAAYVWDYAGRMDFLRYFWDVAIHMDPSARSLDEGCRFPICHPDRLSAEWVKAGFSDVVSSWLDIETVFEDFEDYWNPFLGGQGPAPGFLMSLDEETRNTFKDTLASRLPSGPNGTIRMIARALVVKGVNRQS